SAMTAIEPEGGTALDAAARAGIAAPGHELLAAMYAEAVRDLARHWPDQDGTCEGCGDAYPCAEEWITQRAITGIEARWRREAPPLATAGPAAPPPADPNPAGPPTNRKEDP